MLLAILALVEADDCKKGKACGATCIAIDKVCHQSRPSAAPPVPAYVAPEVPPSPTTYTVANGDPLRVIGPGGSFECATMAMPAVGSEVQVDFDLRTQVERTVALHYTDRAGKPSTATGLCALVAPNVGESYRPQDDPDDFTIPGVDPSQLPAR